MITHILIESICSPLPISETSPKIQLNAPTISDRPGYQILHYDSYHSTEFRLHYYSV